MKRHVTQLSPVDLFTQSGKGWSNLNDIAAAMVKAGAINEDNLVSLSSIARKLGFDLAHMSRLIAGKAGFVRVKQIKRKEDGGLKSTISKGFYYQMDPFLLVAHTEAQDRAYPKNLKPIVDRMVKGEVLTSEIIYEVEETDTVTKEAKARPDFTIMSKMLLAGINPTDSVVVPVASISPIDSTDLIASVGDTVKTALAQWNLDGSPFDTDKLSNKDLDELVDIMASVAFKAVNNYYHTIQMKAERSIK